MKSFRLIHRLMLWGLTPGLLASCQDEGNDLTNPGSFQEVISQAADIEPVPEVRTVDTLSVADPVKDDREETNNGETSTKRWVCTTKKLSVLDGSDEFSLFNTNADVIFPGNLIQGKSLEDATPAPIVVKRAGGTISYDLNNGNLSSIFEVEEVTKSSIQNAMNNIIANAGDVVPANFKLELVEVQSEEQLSLELGIKVKTFTTKVKGNMAFSADRQYNRFLVKLTQAYYTMSFDLPTSLEDLFDPEVRPRQLATYVQADNPATFISSVTYGRIFYMLVESTSSSQEMRARLDASYGAFRNKVEGSVDTESFKSLQNTKIKVIAYGGDASGSFELAGESTIENIANKLAESTNIRAGLPLSYVVRSVERPDIVVGTRLATEYDVTNCDLKGTLPPTGYASLVDLFEDGIGAMVQLNNSNVAFFNKGGEQYAWFNGNSGNVLGIFSIRDAGGPLGASTLDGIGSAVKFLDNRLYFFSKSGLECEIFPFDPAKAAGNSLPSGPIGTYRQSGGKNQIFLVNEIFGDSGNFQFAGRGFNAATRVGRYKMAYFSVPGEEYAVYERLGNGTWENPIDSEKWFGGNGELFDQVGAATTINFGGSSGRYLFINEAGDELMQWFSVPQRKYEGPWVIN